MTTGVFDNYLNKAWPYRFTASLLVRNIHGGTPSDPKKTEGWIRSKLEKKDDAIMALVTKTMAERGVNYDQAVDEVSDLKNLNGFKRDEEHGLYVEGRTVKAAIKEAASVAVASGALTQRGWGKTNKGLLGYIAEHVFVEEDIIPLGVEAPDGVHQRFVHTFRGAGIQLEEYLTEAKISFTVLSDHDFSEKEWAAIWLKGEKQGLGASRSMGCGTYKVVEWTPLHKKNPSKAKV
jgi:hypothetical protein